MDISMILNSALKELAIMFGCFKAYYASACEDGFSIKEVYGENRYARDLSISFDEHVMNKLNSGNISISYSLLEYIGAEPFKQSVLRIIVPVYHLNKMIGVLVLLSYQNVS